MKILKRLRIRFKVVQRKIRRKKIRWLYILLYSTIFFVLVSTLLFVTADTNNRKFISDLISLWGDIATAAAIIWIVYTARIQQVELSLQRRANEETAKSSELDAFLRLLEQISKSISYDVRNLLQIYADENEQDILHGLDNSYASGDTECYLRFVSNNQDFIDWINNSESHSKKISIFTTCESIEQKYEKLIETVDALNDHRLIYETIIRSSPMSHTVRLLKSNSDFQTFSDRDDSRIIS